WAERTPKGVYGPLLFGAELCAWFMALTIAGWFGSRRSHSGLVMLGGMIGIMYMLATLFVLVAIQAPLGIPIWVIVVWPIIVTIPLIMVMARKMSEPGEPMEETPNECWKAGIFYYNPNDAALFVEKREGLGYTFNFANRWSWVLLAGLGVVIASAPL